MQLSPMNYGEVLEPYKALYVVSLLLLTTATKLP